MSIVALEVVCVFYALSAACMLHADNISDS